LPNSPLQGGTSSTTLQGGTQSTTLTGGTESTLLQGGTESTLLKGGAEGTLLQAGVEHQSLPSNILFMFDSSQSMSEKINMGKSGITEPKMEAAKRVLKESLGMIPNDVNVGLRVFGNGYKSDFTDCQQTTLLVPLGRDNREKIIEASRSMAPRGLTPLTFALMQAEQDLRYVQGHKTLILISDGVETCGGDPCAYVERLSKIGIKMKIDIVGLGLKGDKAAQDQLNCIAQKSGGKYYDADTSAELVKSIENSVKQALDGKVMTKITLPKVKDSLPANFNTDMLTPSTKAPAVVPQANKQQK
jgi:Ca-activated chloride channel family protein